MNFPVNLITLFVLSSVFISTSNTIFAQETSATPVKTQHELDLEESKRIKSLERDIAVAEKEIRDSKPKPATAPLEGKTEVDGKQIETQIVTYQMMTESMKTISQAVRQADPKIKVILFYDPEEIENLNRYRIAKIGLKNQIDEYTDHYQKLVASYCGSIGCEAKNLKIGGFKASNLESELKLSGGGRKMLVAALPAIISAVGLAADLLGYLKTDTKITGQELTLSDEAMLAEIARIFIDQGIIVYDPKNYYSYGNDAANSKFLQSLKSLNEYSRMGNEAINVYQIWVVPLIAERTVRKNNIDLEIANLDKLIQTLVPLKWGKIEGSLAELKSQLRIYEAKKTNLESERFLIENDLQKLSVATAYITALLNLNSSVKTFVSSLGNRTDGKRSLMEQHLRAEKIERLIGSENYYWLKLDAVGAGGNNRIRKNAIRFFLGAKLDYTGGTIISWKLYDRDGNIKYSGLDSQYEGYKTSKTLRSDLKETRCIKKCRVGNGTDVQCVKKCVRKP